MNMADNEGTGKFEDTIFTDFQQIKDMCDDMNDILTIQEANAARAKSISDFQEQKALSKETFRRLCKYIEKEETIKEELNVLNSQINEKLQSKQKLKKQTTDNLQQLYQKKSELTESKSEVISSLKQTKEKNATSAKKKELMHLKAKLSLYFHISHLEWNLNASDSTIQGYVTFCGDIKPFTFDLNKDSEVYIADKLWELIAV